MQSQQHYIQVLRNKQSQLFLRYQAIFLLKSFQSPSSIDGLMQCYPFCLQSSLLTHQITYTLGQLPPTFLPLVLPFLRGIMEDEGADRLARHQSAQALANYFCRDVPFQTHLTSTCRELSRTCEIALQKIQRTQLHHKYGKSPFHAQEPAAPFARPQYHQFLNGSKCSEMDMLLSNIPLFDKYRILYMLRDENTTEGKQTLCMLLNKQGLSSLLKHQVCFILGQIQMEGYEGMVKECIENQQEEDIVRHEALAALGGVSRDVEYIGRFTSHPNALIRESAIVAKASIIYNWA